MEYEQFKKRYDAKEFNIGVVPVDARKFFIESSQSRAEEVLGERLFGQFILVKGFWFFFWLLMLLSFVCWVFTIQWWSLIAIPVTFFIYIYNHGMTVSSYQKKGRSLIFLTACIAGSVIWLSDSLWFQLLVVAYPLSILSLKMMYSLSVIYMRDLIVSNPNMYNMFKEELLLQDNATGVTYRGNELQDTYTNDSLDGLFEQVRTGDDSDMVEMKHLTEQVTEIERKKLYDTWMGVVTIAFKMYKAPFEEHWEETITELSKHWDLKMVEEEILRKEIFIALITLDMVFIDDLFKENAPIVRKCVIDYLINMYGNKDYIETLVNDIYSPVAKQVMAPDCYNADEIFNTAICHRLRQPASSEAIKTISILYGYMMQKWHIVKALMMSSEETA